MTLELQFGTLTEALYFEAKVAGETRGMTFVDDQGEEELVTYLQALEEARGTAAAFQRLGIRTGDPIVFVLPTGPDFLYAFFGALLAGAVPCAVSPPGGFGDLDEFAERVAGVVRYLGAPALLTTRGLHELLGARIEPARVIDAGLLRVDVAAHGASAWRPVERLPGDLAYIQCTSGSTGRPKGVVLTHENLISNVYQIGWGLEYGPADTLVTWLPLYHDMGLIGCLIGSLYWNIDCVFMSPFRFLRRPIEWMRTIARHRATATVAPNFAYRLVTTRARDEDLVGLDLSTLRVALCGAEPIDRRTLEGFAARFAPCGLPPTAPAPSYGLAEATLAVTMQRPGRGFVFETVSRAALTSERVARPVERQAAGADAVDVVGCGTPLPEVRVRVVDEEGRALPERSVGEVEVAGASVFQGYYAHDEATRAALRVEGSGRWLRTGDLGYLAGGQLHVTGRRKDILKVRGRQYFPSDFEWSAEEVGGVRKGCVAAFGIQDEAEGTERLHLLCESEVVTDEERRALAAAIADHVARRTGLRPVVHLAPRGSVPKTTSGKLRRSEAKARIVAELAAAGGSSASAGASTSASTGASGGPS